MTYEVELLAVKIMPDGCEILVDEQDASVLDSANWQCVHRQRPGKRTGIYVYASGTRKSLHHTILKLEPGQISDHINGNGLDNRRRNLRVVTNQQNMQNRNGANSNNKTGVRGVSLFRTPKPYWGVSIWLGDNHPSGKRHIVKYFPHTDEGFAEACRMAPILRSELMTHSVEPWMSGGRWAEVVLTDTQLMEWICPTPAGKWNATTHGVQVNAEIVRVWFEDGPMSGVASRIHVLLASPDFDWIPENAIPPVIPVQWISMREPVKA